MDTNNSGTQTVREHLRSNIVGYVALFAVIAGGTASALPGKNKVDSGDIKNGQVKSADIGPDAVGSAAVAGDSLVGADIDESTLELPNLPASLPPSGAAGGDLSGTFPNPSVRESGLLAGGDLSGSLDAAQLTPDAVGSAELAANAVGSPEVANDAVGSTEIANDAVGFSEIATDAVGAGEVGTNAVADDEITNSRGTFFIGAAEMDDSRLGTAGFASPGFTTVGSWPALFFDPAVNELAILVFSVPDNVSSNSTMKLLWSAPVAGQAAWLVSADPFSPGTSDTLGTATGATSNLSDTVDNPDEIEVHVPVGVQADPGDLVKVVIRRNANQAQDTLTSDAALLGVLIDSPTTR